MSSPRAFRRSRSAHGPRLGKSAAVRSVEYRVERFAPPEITPGYFTHQTERSDAQNVMRRDRFRPRDWDVLGWKYLAVLVDRHRAVQPHDQLPAGARRSRVQGVQFRRQALHPPLVRLDGRARRHAASSETHHRSADDWPSRGTAAIANGRGFVFLFNPNYRPMDAVFALDASIGLAAAAGSSFVLRELHPQEGRRIGKPGAGFYVFGDDVRIAMRANEAMVIEITSAADTPAASDDGMLFNVVGRVAWSAGTLALTGVEGEPGTTRAADVIVPPGRTVARVTVNGAPVAFRQSGRFVESTVTFAGSAFGRSHPAFAYDSELRRRPAVVDHRHPSPRLRATPRAQSRMAGGVHGR